MNDYQINLEDFPPTPLINLEPSAPPLPTDIADKRAADAFYGLSDDLPYKTADQITSQIRSGGEQDLRSEATASINAMNKVRSQQAAISAADLFNTPDNLLDYLDQEKKKEVNASSVLEQQFAKKFVESLDKPDAEFFAEYGDLNPTTLREITSGQVAKDRYLLTQMQNLQAEEEGRSSVAKGAEFLINQVPFFGEIQQRGNVPGVGFFSGLKGTNIAAQRNELRGKEDFNEFTNIVDKAVASFSTPTEGIQWLRSMHGEGDWLNDNFSTAMDVLNTFGPSLAALPKGIAKEALVANVANSMRQAANAAAVGAVPTEVAAAAGVGDLTKAATIRIKGNVLAASLGRERSMKETMDALSSIFNYRRNEIIANPGNFGADQVNRLLEDEDAFKAKFFDTMAKQAAVSRVPLHINMEQVINGMLEQVSSEFSQPHNSILDLSVPYFNDFTKTWHYDVHFGTDGGAYFKTQKAAQGFIENKLNGMEGAVAVDRGSGTGWYVRVNRPLIETSPVVRDLLQTGTSKVPETRLGRILGRLLTPEELMSVDDRLNRKIVAYSSNVMRGMFKEEMAQIEKLVKSRGTFTVTKPGVHIGFETDNGDKYTYGAPRGPLGFWEHSTSALTPTQRTDSGGVSSLHSEHTVYVDPLHTHIISETDRKFRLVPNDKTQMLERWGASNVVEEIPRVPDQRNPSSIEHRVTGVRWEKQSEVPYSINPAVGQHPVQLSKTESIGEVGRPAYGEVTQGAPIERLIKTPDEVRAMTGRERFEQFNRTLEYANDAKNPTNPDRPGYWFQNPGQLEDFYLRNFQRLPDADELHAYFAYVRNSDMDWVHRNTQMYKLFSRLGTTEHSINITLPDGRKLTSENFMSIKSDHIPQGHEADDGILVVRADGTVHVYPGKFFSNKKDREELTSAVTEGKAKSMRVVNPDERNTNGMFPLQKFLQDAGWKNPEQRIRYVIAYDVTEHPLRYNIIPYRGGPHAVYEADWYFKQADMRHSNGIARYLGDRTLSAVASEIKGKELLPKLEDLRNAYREDRFTDFANIAASIGVDADTAKSWFRTRGFSTEEPFRLVPKNKKIVNLDSTLRSKHGGAFRDGTKAGSEARQFAVEFMGERDADSLKMFDNLGSPTNPVYKWDPATKLDPLRTLNRAFTRLVNSASANDYKIAAVENWIKDALNNHVFEDGANKVQHSPSWYFEHAEESFVPRLSETNPEVVKRLLATRHQIKQLINVSDDQENFMHRLAQNLSDSIYQNYGNPEGKSYLTKKAMLTPPWLLNTLADAPQFFRSMAFHGYVGLFNPYQFFVQSMTWANMLAVHPIRTMQAVPATLMHFYSSFNAHPNILAGMDRIMQSFGYKPGEYLEARSTLLRTGFDHIGAEHMLMDHQLQPGFAQTAAGKFLDHSAFFFKNAELGVRRGAWFAAFKDFRELHPTGPLSDRDIAQILDRADMLAGNMSKASKSRLQEGFLQYPLQFLGYKLRMVEMMSGQRLTGAEKFRMMATYTALFGGAAGLGMTAIPGAAGVGGVVSAVANSLPMGEMMRAYALNNGYVVGDSFINSLAMEGIPAMALSYLTGDPSATKKEDRPVFFNIGSRSGAATGLDPIRNAIMEDQNLWQILAGASGSYAWNALSSLHPYFQALYDPKNFHVTGADVLASARALSSGVDNMSKAIIAYNTGNWVTKNGVNLETHVSQLQALISGFTGLQSQNAQDTYLMQTLVKTQEATYKKAKQYFITEWSRGLTNARAENYPEADINFKNAISYLESVGYPMEKRPEVYREATQANKSLIDKINYSYWLRNVPNDQKGARQDTWLNIQRVRGAGN